MRYFLLVVSIVALVVSCDGYEANYHLSDSAYLDAAPARLTTVGQSNEAGATVTTVRSQSQLIRNADVSIRVEDAAKAIALVRDIADGHQGFVADSRVETVETGAHRAEIVLRVPAEQFEAAMSALRTIDGVERESVSTQDVSKEYADLETRLRVLRHTEERLHKLLRDSTGSLSEVLEVEREIGRVIGLIEQLEGERRFFDARVAVSTIVVSIYESREHGPPTLFSPISTALGNSLDVLAKSAGFAVYLVTFLIPWLLIATIVWWLVHRIKRFQRAKTRRDQEA